MTHFLSIMVVQPAAIALAILSGVKVRLGGILGEVDFMAKEG